MQIGLAVVKGQRPMLPAADTLEPFLRPIVATCEQCWLAEPSGRPTFGEVIVALEQCVDAAPPLPTEGGVVTAAPAAPPPPQESPEAMRKKIEDDVRREFEEKMKREREEDEMRRKKVEDDVRRETEEKLRREHEEDEMRRTIEADVRREHGEKEETKLVGDWVGAAAPLTISGGRLLGLRTRNHGKFGISSSAYCWIQRLYANGEPSAAGLTIEGPETSCRLTWDGYGLNPNGGRTTEDNLVELCKSGKDEASASAGRAHQWCVNKSDGTISTTMQSSMVLGHGTRTHLARTGKEGGGRVMGGNPDYNDGLLVLVPRGNSRQLLVTAAPAAPPPHEHGSGTVPAAFESSSRLTFEGREYVRIFHSATPDAPSDTSGTYDAGVADIVALARTCDSIHIRDANDPEQCVTTHAGVTWPCEKLAKGCAFSSTLEGGDITKSVASATWRGPKVEQMWNKNANQVPGKLEQTLYHACCNTNGLHLKPGSLCSFHWKKHAAIEVWLAPTEAAKLHFPNKSLLSK